MPLQGKGVKDDVIFGIKKEFENSGPDVSVKTSTSTAG
jgi:hypothetical protein